ncbi:MAG: cation:proton antiporter [Anaeroplasmataceae bacterium]|nr:cation:proton antiporter [Anaeroplasmataceae bacterium]
MVDFQFYQDLTTTSKVLISLSIMLLVGFLMTRVTKLLKLPNVSGYIIGGILIGPYCLKLVSEEMVVSMDFVSDIALSFIAFGVGKFFKKEVLKKAGPKVIVITVFEALMATILVTLSMHFFFKMSWQFSLILGAIASATAPASTMMTIKQYKAKGEFVDVLLQVVALDDIVCLLAFSIATAVATASEGSFQAMDIIKPIGFNILSVVAGILLAIILRFVLNPKRSKDNRLILVIMALLSLCAICSILNVSPLLSCMIFSTVYVNITDDTYLFHQIDNFTPPIMMLFFVLSGMKLNLKTLLSVGVIGVSYFLIRIVGKYLGAFLGCLITKKHKDVKYNLGLALIPQAGVAIGLSVLGQRLLPPDLGNLLSTIILASSVLYEFVGPTCAKASLFLSHSIEWDKKKRSEAEVIDEETKANLEKLVAESNKEYQEILLTQQFAPISEVPLEEDQPPQATLRLNKRNKR